ncbi:alpha-1,3-arabinosyltransferase XAT2-like [Heracleum sosnowskyi]|uniref:Alpha-1,3-arabinosyltransferase XAT2-like n=1 Tax=Heracleum sosnowskyi TaxID=360622 RepID=A0AAD8JKA7_9APIA|nr:alpha-1,3-arabinosyltransferase XAT2-like [Heracleum sosnowskyi]
MKEARSLLYSAARITLILFLVIHLIYTEFFAFKTAQIMPWKQHLWKRTSNLHSDSINTTSSPEPAAADEVPEPAALVDGVPEPEVHAKNNYLNVSQQTISADEDNSTTALQPTNQQEPNGLQNQNSSFKVLLSRLVQEEHQRELESTGLACDSAVHSLVCVVNKPVKIIDKKSSGVSVLYEPSISAQDKTIVRPYARQEDENLLKFVTPVEILQQENSSIKQACHYNHDVPAVLFSSSGFTGNLFHEMNEIIIPLFITSFQFQSKVRFIITDYKTSFVSRYTRLLSKLSRYEVINLAANSSIVHCFPGAVVGLKFHDFLGINSSEIPRGYFMKNFKHFLRETYSLKTPDVSKITTPTLLLVSRQHSRTFLNENQLVNMIKESGFQVIVAKPKRMANLGKFAKLVSSCSVMVGAHGAGLANEVFLPAGAVMVQVVPLGLDWASNAYFGEPAYDMGVHYLEYKIEPEESSLINSYKRDHPIIADPTRVLYKDYEAGRALYIDGQNMKIDLARFKKTLNEARKLLG